MNNESISKERKSVIEQIHIDKIKRYSIARLIPGRIRNETKLISSLMVENDKLNRKHIKNLCAEVTMHKKFIESLGYELKKHNKVIENEEIGENNKENFLNVQNKSIVKFIKNNSISDNYKDSNNSKSISNRSSINIESKTNIHDNNNKTTSKNDNLNEKILVIEENEKLIFNNTDKSSFFYNNKINNEMNNANNNNNNSSRFFKINESLGKKENNKDKKLDSHSKVKVDKNNFNKAAEKKKKIINNHLENINEINNKSFIVCNSINNSQYNINCNSKFNSSEYLIKSNKHNDKKAKFNLDNSDSNKNKFHKEANRSFYSASRVMNKTNEIGNNSTMYNTKLDLTKSNFNNNHNHANHTHKKNINNSTKTSLDNSITKLKHNNILDDIDLNNSNVIKEKKSLMTSTQTSFSNITKNKNVINKDRKFSDNKRSKSNNHAFSTNNINKSNNSSNKDIDRIATSITTEYNKNNNLANEISDKNIINNSNLSKLIYYKVDQKMIKETNYNQLHVNYEKEMREKAKQHKLKVHIEKVKSVDERKYNKEIKNILFQERLLKQMLNKPRFIQDDFIASKIKHIRQTTFNLDEMMKKVNPFVNKIKLERFMEYSDFIKLKNRENLVSSNFRNLRYRLHKELKPNLNNCFSVINCGGKECARRSFNFNSTEFNNTALGFGLCGKVDIK